MWERGRRGGGHTPCRSGQDLAAADPRGALFAPHPHQGRAAGTCPGRRTRPSVEIHCARAQQPSRWREALGRHRKKRRASGSEAPTMNQAYTATVQLLLAIAPAIFETPVFAMKGGTALNLFVQDLPRLSVDIDVVFVRHDMSRDEALEAIKAELAAAAARIKRTGFTAEVRQNRLGDEAKMFVRDDGSEVKVEVNFVFRGTLLPPVRTSLTAAAQNLFAATVEVPVLATAELYGSKLVAAMDRQHPRDLFDVEHMIDRFGLPQEFVDCFVAYLSGHNRPIHEVLFASPKPLAEVFNSEFVGMTIDPVTLEQLETMQKKLLDTLPAALTADHRAFLLSLARAEPDWDRMPFAHLRDLPAVRWKLLNLGKLRKSNAKRFAQQQEELAARFSALDSASSG